MNQNEQIERWEKAEEDRKSRLKWSEGTEQYREYGEMIYLYETSPLDYWENWKNLAHASHHFYHEEINSIEDPLGDAKQKLFHLERTLIYGLIYFADVFKQAFRMDGIKYCLVDEVAEEKEIRETRSVFVLALKMDNNGTCYAISHSRRIGKWIPHDFGDNWELDDAYKIIK